MDLSWDFSCLTDDLNDVVCMERLGLEHNISTAVKDEVFYYHRGLENVKAETQILVLLHGYPQTNFMWRHVVSLLPKDIPLFVPDLPGYGRSSPLSIPHNKRNVGKAILDTLNALLPNATIPQSILLAGHDRGARVCHRLLVDAPIDSRFKISGTILLDIMPATVQWQKFQVPSAAVGFYHWAFLANVELATSMIKGFGGDNYVRSCINRWSGKNEAGIAKSKENDAENLYGNFFKYEHIVRASCDDYRAGAYEDLVEEEKDQKEGRKMDSDTLVLYSSLFLSNGSRGNIKDWELFMGKGNLELKGLVNNVGHFLAEEAPGEVAVSIEGFYKSHS